MSYVIIQVRAGVQRELVPDKDGNPLVFERRRTALAYVATVLDKTAAAYKVYKTDRLPEYLDVTGVEPCYRPQHAWAG